MIKLSSIVKHIKEDQSFDSDFPSAFEGENEAIEDYVNAVKKHSPQGVTMIDVVEDMPKAAHSLQLKVLISLAKKGLLNMSIGNIKIRPNEVLKIYGDTFDTAMGVMLDPSRLNERKGKK